MNVIFGSATTSKNNRYFERLCDEVEKIYGEKPSRMADARLEIQSGHISDGGVVIGCAGDDQLSLVYLGALQNPLPDWGKGTPLDNPDATAHYLLSRYKALDLKFFDNVFGHYSVAICDNEKNSLVLGGDPQGASTLYYAQMDGSLVFCSNLFAVASAFKDKVNLDRSLEDFFLVYGFMPWNRLPFKGIQPLSGSVLVWHSGDIKIQQVEKRNPWLGRFPDIDYDTVTETDAVDLLYDAFMAATEEQLASSKDAAVLLGGFDSALVASALNRLGKRVETFSFHYDDPECNQTNTDTLAEYLGTQHNWVHIMEQIMQDGLLNYPLKFNRPTNWPNYVIQTEHLCLEIRKRGFFHCYTGDGCDGIFLGYPRTHTMAKFYQSSFRMPHPILHLILKFAQWPVLEYSLGRPYRVLLNIIRNLGRKMPMRGYLNFRVFDELSLTHLRTDSPPKQEFGIEEMLEKLTQDLHHLTFDRLAYQGKAAVSANKSKMLGSSDSSGITILAPYLHPGLDALARRLPDRLCRPEDEAATAITGKYILMKMAERKKLLPAEVIYQEKISAVDAPVDDWYFGPLKDVMLDIMQDLPFTCDERFVKNLLRPKVAEKLYKAVLSSDHITTHELSLLATYSSFTKALK